MSSAIEGSSVTLLFCCLISLPKENRIITEGTDPTLNHAYSFLQQNFHNRTQDQNTTCECNLTAHFDGYALKIVEIDCGASTANVKWAITKTQPKNLI